MALSKTQLGVVEALQNGGWIWSLGEIHYLATKHENGSVSSKRISIRTLAVLIDSGAVLWDPGSKQYLLSQPGLPFND